MKKLLFCIFLFLVSFSAFSAVKVFVISESQYKYDDMINLPIAEKDADEFYKAISSVCGAEVVRFKNLSHENFYDLVERWANSAKEGDTLIFYYSGHGMSRGKRFYLVPSDFDPYYGYPLVLFEVFQAYIPIGVKVLWIVDVCYSRNIVKEISLSEPKIKKENLKIGKDQAMIISCRGDETSLPRKDGSGGIFTQALVEAIRNEVDRNSDGWIDAGELYEYVKERVEELSGKKQHPMLIGNSKIKAILTLQGAKEMFKEYLSRKLERGELTSNQLNAMVSILDGKCKMPQELERYIEECLRMGENKEILLRIIKSYLDSIECWEIKHQKIPEGKKEALLTLKPGNDLATGADVYIDGKLAGKIDKKGAAFWIRAGKHEVKITSERINDISFEFVATKNGRYEKVVTPKPATRVVRLVTDPPGAYIYVDEKKIGKTPKFIELEVGKKHEIVLRKPNYKKKKEILNILSKGHVLEKSYKLKKIRVVVEWQRAHGGYHLDEAYSIQQTRDGGYIVAGEAISESGEVKGNHGGGDGWVIKLDEKGCIEWSRALGGSEVDDVRSVQQTRDGGFILAVYTRSNDGDVSGNHGDADFWIVKLDSKGKIQWQRTLGGSGCDVISTVKQTEDGGYIAVGTTESNDGDVSSSHGGPDIWVVKLDGNGKVQWEKTLGGSGRDEGYTIMPSGDEGCIVVGWTASSDGDLAGGKGGSGLWIVKLDKRGNIEWQRLVKTFISTVYSIEQTRDGGYILAGHRWSYNNLFDIQGDFWVAKLDSKGNFQWERTFGGSAEDIAYWVDQTRDGGYIVAGYTSSNDGDVSENHGYADAWIIKLDSEGYLEWEKSFGGKYGDIAYSIQETADGGYIFAGYTESEGSEPGSCGEFHGYRDFWIVKLAVEEE